MLTMGNVVTEQPSERQGKKLGCAWEIVSTILEGRRHPIKTFYGVIKGGKLKFQRGECLDARFFDYDSLPDLAFAADRRAIDIWQKMKADHQRLASKPLPSACPYCDGSRISIRNYPHRTNHYRCQTCKNTLESATRPWKMLRPGDSDNNTNGWQHIGRICVIAGSDLINVPEWVADFISTPDAMRTALYKRGFWQLVGRNYRYALVPSGQGVSLALISTERRGRLLPRNRSRTVIRNRKANLKSRQNQVGRTLLKSFNRDN